MTDTNDDFSGWVDRSESVDEALGVPTAQAAAAMLDLDPDPFRDGAELPPLWHWFYFLGKTPQSQLGEDGHPARRENSFMPPIPLPRRMFAGARLRWHAPMALGRTVRRETVIHSIERKTGRSGDLAFVTVACRFTQDGALWLEEEQDIVYRGPGQPVSAVEPVVLSPPPATSWSQLVVPDTRLLFRFSALTFNAHRIHYDRPYAMNEEKYPGLVVHGPLTAILLLQLVRNNSSRPVAEFRPRPVPPCGHTVRKSYHPRSPRPGREDCHGSNRQTGIRRRHSSRWNFRNRSSTSRWRRALGTSCPPTSSKVRSCSSSSANTGENCC